jgi:CRP-like cAMP-binding protein
MDADKPSVEKLVEKVRRLAPIDADDEGAIRALRLREEQIGARDYLVREGTVPTECCLLIEGYAQRSKIAADGGRQIVSFHVPGDILDLQHLFLGRADHYVQAVTDATVAWVPMSDLRSLIADRPVVGSAFWRDVLIDASIFREWVLNVGRRDAKTRIAHMLCEFIVRNAAAGGGEPGGMEIPFTQEEIADATGLTPIHVNRMLRTLTDAGLIRRNGRRLEVHNWPGLRHAAVFDEAYLHAAA